jgi:multiple sugar transport system substrate-binding protein/putative aldouronate transport system substrate-binding protein
MNKIIKKMFGCGISGLMAVTLVGCSSSAASGSTASGDPIKLTVFSQTANWSGAQTGWGATLLKDLFNVELTVIPDTNGAYQTRMESGDLGDIVVWGTKR